MVEGFGQPGMGKQHSIISRDAVSDLGVMLYMGASEMKVQNDAVVNSNRQMVQAMS